MCDGVALNSRFRGALGCVYRDVCTGRWMCDEVDLWKRETGKVWELAWKRTSVDVVDREAAIDVQFCQRDP